MTNIISYGELKALVEETNKKNINKSFDVLSAKLQREYVSNNKNGIKNLKNLIKKVKDNKIIDLSNVLGQSKLTKEQKLTKLNKLLEAKQIFPFPSDFPIKIQFLPNSIQTLINKQMPKSLSKQSKQSKQPKQSKQSKQSKQDFPDGYEYIETLGAGAFGKVVKAIDKKTNKLVAIKLQTWEEDTNIFLKEIENLRKISNKCENLVCIIDSGIYTKGKYYIVMNYIDGQSLDIYVNKNPTFLLNAFKQLTAAVLKLHKAGIAHNDIKPDNIMVDSKGKLYLVDLGLSCFRDSECIGGTAGFIAPDLDPNDYSVKGRQASDIWAIGYTFAYIMKKQNYADEVWRYINEKIHAKSTNPLFLLDLLAPVEKRMKVFKKLEQL